MVISNQSVVKATSGTPTTTTVDVAAAFEKPHKSVMRAVRNLECSKEFIKDNFQETTYKDSSNRIKPAVEMTKDGFTFLVMGFSGKKAAAAKEVFIGEFNRLEQRLRLVSSSQPASVMIPLTQRVIQNHQKVPAGYFSMIAEAGIRLIMPLEFAGATLPASLLPDSSLGRGFCKILRDEYGVNTDNLPVYIHSFPDGRRVEAKLYPNEYLPLFLNWFNTSWLPDNAPRYFKSRAPAVLAHLPKLLTAA